MNLTFLKLFFSSGFVFGAQEYRQMDAPTFCCQALMRSGLEGILSFPSQALYQERISSYWSKTAQLEPTCILQPRSASQLSTAVKTLVAVSKVQECKFAVRSGGHTPSAGVANIQNGVTIDLGMMNDVEYHEASRTVSIQAGARWGKVYEYLDKLGIGVAGGRAASVGVGGLILGGGNSFYAAREGFVCDNVVNFEIVLGSGEIVNANSKTNPDLFRVLKGGSNNLGIVTRFDMSTIEGASLWGGVAIYPESTAETHLHAIVNFGNNIEADPYGSAIVIWAYSTDTRQTTIFNAYDYTKPIERPEAFKEFLSIPSIVNTLRITNMTSLSSELSAPYGFRDAFYTLTFKNDIRVLRKVVELHHTLVENVGYKSTNWTMRNLIQPIPTLFSKRSVSKGGNVLGLDRFDENLILFQTFLIWHKPEEDELFHHWGSWMISQLDTYAKSIGQDNPFIYLDYADASQNPLKGYGEENLARMRAASAKYDPDGVFQRLVPGGFKLAAVD